MMDKMEKLPAVLGVGNALIDIIVQLENEDILEEFNLPRGSMTLVDAELSKKIYDSTYYNKREITTGGSAANTIRTLAAMGGNCGYCGKVGDDKLGHIFINEFKKKGINTHLTFSETDTGRVIGLVSPDSERTMATYLGAAAELRGDGFSKGLYERYGYLYIEGYLVQDHSLIGTAVEVAKQAGLQIAIDLSSFNIVEANLGFLKELVKSSVDIVFANEEEAYSFTGKNPIEALDEIASMCELAIVKIGKEGSLIKKGEEVIRISPVLANAVDTTGAGDSFAAGFFYGLTKGYSLQKCGNIASFISAKVVEVMGPNLPENVWEGLNKKISKL